MARGKMHVNTVTTHYRSLPYVRPPRHHTQLPHAAVSRVTSKNALPSMTTSSPLSQQGSAATHSICNGHAEIAIADAKEVFIYRQFPILRYQVVARLTGIH